MAVYFVTGKLGAGKTLSAVGRIRDYINRKRPVATNLDINVEKFRRKQNKSVLIYRLPDRPGIEDLDAIGIGNSSYDEDRNGLLVLDECGTWFNPRNWQDKSRAPLIDWFLHARKRGWDVMFIVQDVSLVDKQAREALCEYTVLCRRLDRIRIPFIGGLLQAFGIRAMLPRLHLGRVIYGDSVANGIIADRWMVRGTMIYPLYDTKQIFRANYEHGVYCLLTPWHLVGRYQQRTDWRKLAVSACPFLLKLLLYGVVCITATLQRRSRWGVAARWGLLGARTQVVYRIAQSRQARYRQGVDVRCRPVRHDLLPAK